MGIPARVGSPRGNPGKSNGDPHWGTIPSPEVLSPAHSDWGSRMGIPNAELNPHASLELHRGYDVKLGRCIFSGGPLLEHVHVHGHMRARCMRATRERSFSGRTHVLTMDPVAVLHLCRR